MSYKRLFRYLVMIMIGGLGLFNSYKLELRYEANSNLELLCQNGIIVSSIVIIYFALAFMVEILLRRNLHSKKPSRVRQRKFEKNTLSETEEVIGAQEFYEKETKEEE